MNEGEGLVEFRPTCSKVDCEEPPLSGRYLCRRHEAEVAMAVAPGIPESRWAGGVPEAEAAKRTAELERQYEAQALTDVIRALVKDGCPEEEATAEAERRVKGRPRPPGPDPDTAYPPETLRAVKHALEGEAPPVEADPMVDFTAYYRGDHGLMKRQMARVLVEAMITVLRRL